MLEFFAEVLEDDVADQGGEDGDGEVGGGEDVAQGEGEGLAAACRAAKLSHEEVGVEEKDDEADLDERAQDVAERARRVWGRGHGMILLRMKRSPTHSAENAEWMGHPNLTHAAKNAR